MQENYLESGSSPPNIIPVRVKAKMVTPLRGLPETLETIRTDYMTDHGPGKRKKPPLKHFPG